MGRQFWGKVGSVAAVVATLHFFHSIVGPHGFFERNSETALAGPPSAPAVPQRARLFRIPDEPVEQPETEAVRETASIGVPVSLLLVGFASALWFAARGRLRLQAR